jgi:hypothetical protein
MTWLADIVLALHFGIAALDELYTWLKKVEAAT